MVTVQWIIQEHESNHNHRTPRQQSKLQGARKISGEKMSVAIIIIR